MPFPIILFESWTCDRGIDPVATVNAVGRLRDAKTVVSRRQRTRADYPVSLKSPRVDIVAREQPVELEPVAWAKRVASSPRLRRTRSPVIRLLLSEAIDRLHTKKKPRSEERGHTRGITLSLHDRIGRP